MKKFIAFCLVFLLIGTMFAFSQNITQTISMRCTSYVFDGQELSQNVRVVNFEIHDDVKTFIRLTFNDGSFTEYHLTNQRRGSNNQIEYDVSVVRAGGTIDTCIGLAAVGPGTMSFTIYQGRVSAANQYSQMTLRTN